MFSRLRVRIIVLIMTISGVLLAGIFCWFCAANYIQTVNLSYNNLKEIAKADIPADWKGFDFKEDTGRFFYSFSGVLKLKVRDNGSALVVERINEVLFDIEDKDLSLIVKTILNKDESTGTLKDFVIRYYKAEPNSNGEIVIVLGNYAGEKQYLSKLISVAIGSFSFGISIIFLISLLVSKKITKPLENVWRNQQQFIANASHELKTPISVIMANNNILLNHQDDKIADRIQWINSTQVVSLQMKELLNEMLYLAKYDAKLVRVEKKRLDFSELVHSTVLSFDSVAFENNVEINLTADNGIFVNGNEVELRNLIGILLENAIKYSDKGNGVDVILKRVKKRVEFTVKNHGEVIGQDEIPFVFDRFYRVDKSRSKKISGFGLGLSIAKNIVDSHNGSITCESNVNSGTSFTVTMQTME